MKKLFVSQPMEELIQLLKNQYFIQMADVLS